MYVPYKYPVFLMKLLYVIFLLLVLWLNKLTLDTNKYVFYAIEFQPSLIVFPSPDGRVQKAIHAMRMQYLLTLAHCDIERHQLALSLQVLTCTNRTKSRLQLM
jgi:hypothetical protein